MSNNKVGFFQTIIRSEDTIGAKVANFCERALNLSGRVYRVIPKQQNKVREVHENTGIFITGLKIIACATLVIPFFLYLGKAISRANSSFTIKKEKDMDRDIKGRTNKIKGFKNDRYVDSNPSKKTEVDYCKMIEETINRLQNDHGDQKIDIRIETEKKPNSEKITLIFDGKRVELQFLLDQKYENLNKEKIEKIHSAMDHYYWLSATKYERPKILEEFVDSIKSNEPELISIFTLFVEKYFSTNGNTLVFPSYDPLLNSTNQAKQIPLFKIYISTYLKRKKMDINATIPIANYESSLLCTAVKKGASIPFIDAMIELGSNLGFLEIQEPFVNTALTWAIANAANTHALHLINKCSLDVINSERCKKPFYAKGLNALALIVAKGYKNVDGEGKKIAISNYELAEAILKRGANVNQPDSLGRTPIYWAAMRRDKKMMQLLIKYGATQSKKAPFQIFNTKKSVIKEIKKETSLCWLDDDDFTDKNRLEVENLYNKLKTF